MRINGDQWAAQFLRNEPDYGEFDWLDTYAMAFSRYKPELRPQEVAETAAQRTQYHSPVRAPTAEQAAAG